MCLNNAIRPKLIITITIKKRIRILKRIFEKKRRKKLYVATLYMTGKILAYYQIVKETVLAIDVLHSLQGMPLVARA